MRISTIAEDPIPTIERVGHTYYHGSSDRVINTRDHILLPPIHTGTMQEKGRKRNLDQVFFTRDLASAKIYAGRAVQRFGGRPIIVRVIPMGQVHQLNYARGTTVFHSDWAFYEPIKRQE